MKKPDRGIERLALIESQGRNIAKVVKAMLPKNAHFVLFLADEGEGGWSTYVSDIQREDMCNMIDEMMPALRGGTERPPIKPESN